MQIRLSSCWQLSICRSYPSEEIKIYLPCSPELLLFLSVSVYLQGCFVSIASFVGQLQLHGSRRSRSVNASLKSLGDALPDLDVKGG